MKADVYGRFQLEVTREKGQWIAYRLEPGKRIKLPELAIPENLEDGEIPKFLDDIFHEMSKPGQTVRIVA